MTQDELHLASPILSHVFYADRAYPAPLLPPEVVVLDSGQTRNSVALTGDSVIAVVEQQAWLEGPQPRWAFLLKLDGVYAGMVVLGSTPDASGFLVEVHCVAASTPMKLADWFAEWVGDKSGTRPVADRLASALLGLDL